MNEVGTNTGWSSFGELGDVSFQFGLEESVTELAVKREGYIWLQEAYTLETLQSTVQEAWLEVAAGLGWMNLEGKSIKSFILKVLNPPEFGS